MNKLPIILVFLVSVAFIFASEKSNDSSYGLIVQSSPSPAAQKTSLVLENNSPIVLEKQTSLSFQMLVRDEYLFGLVVRMVTNQNKNIDLMLTVTETFRHPILVINELAHAIRQPVVTEEWIPVAITLNKVKNEIILDYAGQKLNIPYDLSLTSDVRISFGTCSFKSFESSDIASVNIRDVKIFNDDVLKRYWKLKEHRQNFVLDSVAQVAAVAINPQWLIDIHSTWKKIYFSELPFNTQIAFDNNGMFYLVSPDSRTIRVFDTKSENEEQIHTRNGFIVSTSPNTLFYDSANKQLVSYNLRDNLSSRYSFDSNEWSSSAGSTTDPFLNNSAVYHSSDKILYSFGGYEYYKYSHSLVKMNPATGEQKRTELMDIQPRFSASTAIVGNTMYIFGGRGSKTGKQEIAPHNYYDFYSVDLLMGQAVGLWSTDSVPSDFLPGENMIFDAEHNCFYVFTTQDGGLLMKIESDRKCFETMSFPIGESIDALYLYTNLYYDAAQKKIFALIYQQKTKDRTNISIYSLDYPPVPIQSLSQSLPSVVETSKWRLVLILMGGSVVCAMAYMIRKKKRGKPVNNKPAVSPETEEESAKAHKTQYYDLSKSSICLLKHFNVIDKEGNNITEQFSPTLKNLLILLILSSEKDEKGIFGSKMIQLLWPNKTEESAKNSFYVYLSKLRSLLEKTGDMEIINKNGFWSLRSGNKALCDYTESMRLFTSLKTNHFKDNEQTSRLIELLLRGVLLPNTEIDWVDNYKSDFSNLTIDVLTKLAHEEKYRMSNELRFKIADTLLLHDVINEDGLYIKCSLLFNSGKKGIAKTVYDNFCKEYKNLLGIHYKYSLTEVLNSK